MIDEYSNSACLGLLSQRIALPALPILSRTGPSILYASHPVKRERIQTHLASRMHGPTGLPQIIRVNVIRANSI